MATQIADNEPARIPAVLSKADTARYTRLFALQARGDWAAADALISHLDDTILMGHVLFQRYMHPTAYQSSYAELEAWLATYSDHPGARRIYQLALRRPRGRSACRSICGSTAGPPGSIGI